MSIDFQDAAPVKISGNGRKAEPNPYEEIVQAIALQKNDDGEPVAKKFQLTHDKGERDKAVAKVKRQMSEAGERSNPKVTVRVHTEPVTNPVNHTESETKTSVTFWTVARQVRPRQASTEQTDAVTNEPTAE